jgi:hypothetical protein
MKNKLSKYFLVYYIIVIVFFSSCVSFEPKENKYVNYTYEQMIKKHGKTKHDNVYIVNNNFEPSFIAPNYSLYFTEEELVNGVQVRALVWEKIFNNRLLVWLKLVDEQWLVFNSLEYNRKFVKF